MDLSKLDQNDKLAVYGAIAAIVGPILASLAFGFGVGWLTLLLAIAMIVIIFLPQWSPQTTLPGSKGSLMLIVGGIAAVSAILALLGSMGVVGLFGANFLFVIGWLLGIAGGLLMGWAGWQAFQAEGGKFQLGNPSTTSPPPAPPPATDTAAAPPPAAPAPPEAAPPPAAAPPPPAAADAGRPADDPNRERGPDA